MPRGTFRPDARLPSVNAALGRHARGGARRLSPGGGRRLRAWAGRSTRCLAGAITAPGSAYDRSVSRKHEVSPEIGAELARLRKLEQSLRAERERIRASAAAEVHQLQTALRETAARAAHREREVQHLRGEVQRGAPSGLSATPPRGSAPGTAATPMRPGAIERVRASFERERRQLEETGAGGGADRGAPAED